MEFKGFTSIGDLFRFLESETAPDTRGRLDAEHAEQLTAQDALEMAKGAACGAQNDTAELQILTPESLDGNDERFRMAVDYLDILIASKQKQADVWLAVHDRLKAAEDTPTTAQTNRQLVRQLAETQAELSQTRNNLQRLAEELESKRDAKAVVDRYANAPAEDMTVADFPDAQAVPDSDGR